MQRVSLNYMMASNNVDRTSDGRIHYVSNAARALNAKGREGIHTVQKLKEREQLLYTRAVRYGQNLLYG